MVRIARILVLRQLLSVLYCILILEASFFFTGKSKYRYLKRHFLNLIKLTRNYSNKTSETAHVVCCVRAVFGRFGLRFCAAGVGGEDFASVGIRVLQGNRILRGDQDFAERLKNF